MVLLPNSTRKCVCFLGRSWGCLAVKLSQPNCLCEDLATRVGPLKPLLKQLLFPYYNRRPGKKKKKGVGTLTSTLFTGGPGLLARRLCVGRSLKPLTPRVPGLWPFVGFGRFLGPVQEVGSTYMNSQTCIGAWCSLFFGSKVDQHPHVLDQQSRVAQMLLPVLPA